MMTRRNLLVLCACILLTVSAPLVASAGCCPLRRPAVPSADSAVPTTVGPITLVDDGVTSYHLAAPKVFWHSASLCGIPPAQASALPTQSFYEEIQRVPWYGSRPRKLYSQEVSVPQCEDDVISNILADDDCVYWMSRGQGGVVCLSTDASVGDGADLLNSNVSGEALLAQDAGRVYVLSSSSGLWGIEKETGQAQLLSAQAGSDVSDLQADGIYVYWLDGGNLKRRLGEGAATIDVIASGVTGYHPEGRYIELVGDPPVAVTTDYVFVGQDDEVYRYNNLTGQTTGPLYESSDGTAAIYSLVTDDTWLFVLESRYVDGQAFDAWEAALVRLDKEGGSGDILYITDIVLLNDRPADRLSAYWDYLFWQEARLDSAPLIRLPKEASELPLTNMRLTELELTQGIQDLDNSVGLLVVDRRTFVRVYAESDGPIVPGVTAYLYRTDASGSEIGSSLDPVNPVGRHITVRSGPPHFGLNSSFLFELPWEWTAAGELYLRAELNPNRVPPEETYDDNTLEAGPFEFWATVRQEVTFVRWGFHWKGEHKWPLESEMQNAYSLIRRMYPVPSAPGYAGDPSPGFRPREMVIQMDSIGCLTDPTCTDKSFYCLFRSTAGDNWTCANKLATAVMHLLRLGAGTRLWYGMMPYGGRGVAYPGWEVACGPSHRAITAAHEIGHLMERDHPYKGSSKDTGRCGQGPDDGDFDYAYPYRNGQIGTWDKRFNGFDTGDAALGQDMDVLIWPTSYDVMSYCSRRWLSDYTYSALYFWMMIKPPKPMALSGTGLSSSKDDQLAVFGSMGLHGNWAEFQLIRRVGDLVEIPDLDPGYFSIRLVDAGGGVLADYPFTPGEADNAALLRVGQVVDYVEGTAEVQIVRLSDDKVLARHPVSDTPPEVRSVVLVGAPEPVTGVVTLSWEADDADGDELAFDIYYSGDGGTTLQPIKLGHVGTSSEIDTDLFQLGGSANALFRVVANDGAHTGAEATATFVMTDRAPRPRIAQPADGHQMHYGQLLNLEGEAWDPQDGAITGQDLVWKDGNLPLGTGPLLSFTDLKVGVHEISLTATNSAGLSASTSVTVIVDDDVSLPGPTLSVAPSEVNWDLAPGTLALQTADLTIHNAGGGSLDWEASDDAAWLTLSAEDGSTPVTLTLTADPSGLAAPMTLSATLEISASESPNADPQIVTVPVSLSTGDKWSKFPTHPATSTYLPLVVRELEP